MKATPHLRALIDQAAQASGLSVAQEVERRLIESLAEEKRLGGKETAALARTIAGNIQWIEQAQEGRWYEDDVCFRALTIALPEIMNRCRKTPLQEVVDEIVNSAAVDLAFRSLDALDEQRLSDYSTGEAAD
ncbi:MAG: hypothetical protein ACR2JJ_04395 [Sphingomicrobium sp.]